MANRTAKDAHSVKGTNPQYLIEKIIRSRIYESKYWKEECFALSAELVVDKAMQLRAIGGIFGGNVKPTPFICLVLKMLQIQPEKDIVIEFIKNEDFKYVRALGATYLRLTGTALDCYKYLEPLYLDYRKVRRMSRDGVYSAQQMDEFIDELLREERVVDVILPRIQKRHVLEEANQIEPRLSALDDDLDMEISDAEEGEYEETLRDSSRKSPERPKERRRTPSPPRRHRSRSPQYRTSRRSRSRERDRYDRHDRDREDRRERDDRRREDRHRDEKKDRKRSRSRERHRHSHKHRHQDEERSHRHRKSKKEHRDKDKHREHRSSKSSKEQLEIDEANAQRAKLGLPPLK